MKRVGIVGNGPKGQLPTLLDYQEKKWIFGLVLTGERFI